MVSKHDACHVHKTRFSLTAQLHKSCAPCKTCQSRQVRVNTCSDTRNTVCLCQNGTFWVQDEFKTDEGFCKDHSQCPPGQGLDRKGSAYSDTKCVDCIQGKTFSNVSSLEECKVCTRCNATYESSCTKTLDFVCLAAYKVERAQASDPLLVVVVPVVLVLTGAVIVIIVLYKRLNSGPYVNTELEDDTDMTLSTTESPALSSRNEVQNKTIQKLNTDAVSKKETDKRSRKFLNHTQTTEYLAEEPVGKCNSLSEDAGRVSPRSTLSEGLPAVGFYQGVQAVNPQRTFQPQESVESRDSMYSTWRHTSWDQVMTYLEQNLKRSEFMMFFRKLASQNNLDYCSKIEAELSNKQVENGNIFSDEVVHQLMLRFRQATPAVTPRAVICALRLCNLKLHADTLSRIIALDWCDEQRSGNTSSSAPVRGELES